MDREASLDSQTELRPAPDASPPSEFLPEILRPRGNQVRPEFTIGELAFRVLVAFRVHPHLSNVLTHISGANWAKVERSLNSIFDLATTSGSLSTLDQNFIDLMCADRGITGRIMKPYLHAVLRRVLEPDQAERLIRHVNALFLELGRKQQQLTRAAPSQSESPSQESGRADASRNERVVSVADIDPRHRHTIIFRLFEHLAPDNSLQLVVDHDPKPLRLQLEARHGSRCNWSYLEKGPDIWRIRLCLLRAESGVHA